jgi:hypothetical protein
MTPLGSAVLELVEVRGWTFRRACRLLADRFENDLECPVSGCFTAAEIRNYYKGRVNVVALPAPECVR